MTYTWSFEEKLPFIMIGLNSKHWFIVAFLNRFELNWDSQNISDLSFPLLRISHKVEQSILVWFNKNHKLIWFGSFSVLFLIRISEFDDFKSTLQIDGREFDRFNSERSNTNSLNFIHFCQIKTISDLHCALLWSFFHWLVAYFYPQTMVAFGLIVLEIEIGIGNLVL